MATEIADAYIALYAKMPGIKGDIEKSLGGSDVQGAVDGAGKKSGSTFTAGLGKVLKGGAIAVGIAAAAGLGVALAKGFGRLEAIDVAEKKLTGLGQSTENISVIMDNASKSVKGTAFGLGDAATAAASLVAANIKPGEQLEGVLKSVANSASAAGVGINDMGGIYAKVASLGKAQNDVLQQVADKGIPIYAALANNLGVTTEEVFAMASAGKIGFAEFEAAMTSASGTVAEEMGKTIPGATSNFLASLGRIGAGLLGGIYPYIAPLISAVTSALGPIEDLAAGVGEKIGQIVGPALQGITDMLNGGFNLGGFGELLSLVSPLGFALRVLEPILPVLLASFSDLGGVLGGAFSSILTTLVPIVVNLANTFAGILAAVLPQILPIITQLATVFAGLLTAILPLVGTLLTALLPAFNLISPLIAALVPIFSAVIAAVLPIVEAIFPLLSSLIATLAPIFSQLVAAVLPLLTPILGLLSPLLELVGVILPPLIELIGFVAGVIANGLSAALSFLIPIITGVVTALTTYLIPIITTVTNVLSGLITFLTGVFTGNWEQAWQGIQDIFSSIWTGVQDIAKGALNGVIELINGVIGGINGLAGGLSDLTGGAIDLSIPDIPKLAAGGVVSARPGGIPAIIGEGRYDEAVVPLSPQILGQLGGGGTGEVNQYNSFPKSDEDPAVIARIVGRRLQEAMQDVPA